MAAIDFPVPTQVGETFTDSAGVTYVCRVIGPPAVWAQDISGALPGGNLVTTDTTQTITGAKTFTANTKFGPDASTTNITLNTNGSATFEGEVDSKVGFVAYGDGDSPTEGNFRSVDATNGDVATALILANGGAQFGGDPDTLQGNIQLNADGTASFADDVTVGADPTGGTNRGILFDNLGAISVTQAGVGNYLFKGFIQGTSTRTSAITAYGVGEFVSGNIVLDSESSGGCVRSRQDTAENRAIQVLRNGFTNDDEVAAIYGDGSASFAGNVTTGNAALDAAAVTSAETFAFPNKSGTFAMTSDITGGGQVEFKGPTDVTGTPPSGVSAGNVYVNIVAGTATNAWTGIEQDTVALNQLIFYVNDTGSGSAGWVLGGITDVSTYVTLGTDQTITGNKTFNATTTFASNAVQINADGDATLGNGTIQAKKEGYLDLGSPSFANSCIFASNSSANATVYARNYSAGGSNFQGFNSAGASTIDLLADGSASFGSGNITLNADGSASFTGRVAFQRDDNTSAGLVVENAAGDNVHLFYGSGSVTLASNTIQFTETGGASFADSQASIDSTGKVFTNRRFQVNNVNSSIGPGYTVFEAYNINSSSVPVISMGNDGSATFADSITTGDLVMNNTRHENGNEVDGTHGHWCFQEGKSGIYVINRLTGQRYSMNLTPVD